MTHVSTRATEVVLEMLSGGSLRVYDGQKELVALAFSDPAFGTVEDGRATANPLRKAVAKAEGTAQKWVALSNDGVPVLAGEVGDDMLLSQTYIAAGAEVSIKKFTYTQQRA